MAFRAFQLCVVFTIGLWTSPATASPGSVGGSGGGGGGGVAGGGVAGGGEVELSLHLQDPRDVTVARGQPASLHCPADTSDPAGTSVTWRFAGRPLAHNDTRRQVTENGLLNITKVAGKMEGNYSCLVRNQIGALLSNPAKLTIATMAPQFTKQPEDVAVNASQPVHLSCQIQSTPAAVVLWERDRKPLPQSTRYVPLPNGDLLITTAHQSDSGSYRCKVTNELLNEALKKNRSRHSGEGVLTVLSAPSKDEAAKLLSLTNERNYTVHVGSSLSLYCAASGWPKPTIRWTNNFAQVVGNSSVLWLENVTAENSGSYTCIAHNSVGHDMQVHNVFVFQPPYFIKRPASRWFPSALTVRMECTADGNPPPEIRWLKNGEPLALAGRIKKLPTGLLFSHTFTTDSGLYQCVAENAFGRVWSAAQLIANFSKAMPSPPVNVRCRSFDMNSICLQWDAPYGVNVTAYSVHWFHGNVSLDDAATKTYYLAKNLIPDTSYTFYIRLYSIGASDQSENITCKSVMLGARELKFKPLSSTALRVDWNTLSRDIPCGGVAEYKLQWRRAGYASNNADIVSSNHYVMKSLVPSERYQIRVQISNNEDEELPWEEFTMPNFPSNLPSSTMEPLAPVMAPIDLVADPISATNINLTWKDPRGPADKSKGGHYMICYTVVKSRPRQKCEDGKFVKSTSTSIEIKELTPYTLYEFKVRSHNLDGTYGNFSQSVECRTLEFVPDPVSNVRWKAVNVTSGCLRWRVPNAINGQLQQYVVSYSFLFNQSLEKWPRIVLPANRTASDNCWRASIDSVSMYLTPLEANRKYKVVVRAGTNAGLSRPSDGIEVWTSLPADTPRSLPPPLPPPLEEDDDQKLGIIVGVGIALACVIACIACMIFRRRCLKARAMERARMYAPRSTNGQSSSGSTQPVGAASLRVTCPPLAAAAPDIHCAVEAHELQYLVAADEPPNTHIPPLSPSHLDTKGGVTFPNGQANGLKYVSNGHVSNGNVRITENPQFFEPYECNGHYNTSSESHQLLNADRNPNADDSLLDDTFNSTQLTCLEDSLPIVSMRTVSPILGPNG